jgi:hypothetical protein
LQDTKSGDALVIIVRVRLAIFTGLALLFEKFTNNAEIGVAELLTQGHGKGREFGGKDLDKILHDISQCVDIHFICQLEKLLHDGGNALLHAGADDVVPDERLQGQGSSNTNGQGSICHAIQDMSIDGQQIVLVLEVELFEFFNGVASSGTEIALCACEVGEHVSDEEVFDLVGNGTLLAQNHRGERCNHTQGTFFGNVALLVVLCLFILVDNSVDEFENLKRFLSAVLGQVDKKVGGSHVRSRCFLKVVELAVQVFLRLVVELFYILLGKTEHREDEVGDEVSEVFFKVRPRFFGAD